MSFGAKSVEPQALQAGGQQFRINGKVATIYSGAVHYWRLDREKWDDILEKVKGMGFNTVSIYIPWEVHEIKRGEFDFGQINPSNDIDAFLTLCEEKGLNIVVRPGPQINSELTWFGYPLRILEDEEMQAQTAWGSKAVLTQVPRPIPALSYASDKFYAETALWYDAIFAILVKHQYPKGRLIACQVDNEMAFFFHINPYESDFSPSAIRWYQSFLKSKYGSIDELNKVYHKNYVSFEYVDAPRRFSAENFTDIPYHTDWIEFRERYLIDSMDRLAKMIRERGLKVPLFHNYPHPLGPGGSVSGITTPFNLMGLEEKLDYVGFDIYSRKELYAHVKTVVSYVVGSSRFPYIPEFIAGVWPWYLNPGGFEDEEFVTKAALMHGIKGFSRYMIVERNRWLASPVRRDGRVRKANYEVFRRVNEMALGHDFVNHKRQVDVLLMANRDYDRLEAATALISFPGDFLEPLLGVSEYPNFMITSEKTLGFKEAIQQEKANWFTKNYKALEKTGYQFLLSDSDLAQERMQEYKAIVVSSFEFMGAKLQRKLVKYAEAGGTVVLGPRLPNLNEKMESDTALLDALTPAKQSVLVSDGETLGYVYPVGKGQIVHLPQLVDAEKDLSLILDQLGALKVQKNDVRLDLTVHTLPEKKNSPLVFVCNPTAETIEAEVGIGAPMKKVKEIWSGQEIKADGKTWRDTLPAYTIKIYECEG
jgi:beta-galactosidase